MIHRKRLSVNVLLRFAQPLRAVIGDSFCVFVLFYKIFCLNCDIFTFFTVYKKS